MMGKSSETGFTLIELLVVITVLGILAVLGLSVAGKIRQAAESAKISSQIRQILMATELYGGDHGGRLPKVAAGEVEGDPTEFFYLMEAPGVADLENSGLNPYLGGPAEDIWMAPRDHGLKEDGSPGRNFSYTMNFLINKGELQEGATSPSGFEKALGTVRIHLLHKPSEKILIFEEYRPNDGFCVWFIDRPVERHGGRAHVGFADGHVALMPTDEIFGNADLCELVPPGAQY
jgi:prepilin-type N-terminal cleavage/methylation domain-containing protein/prepilin-type processing-associated H-X9-DG protein